MLHIQTVKVYCLNGTYQAGSCCLWVPHILICTYVCYQQSTDDLSNDLLEGTMRVIHMTAHDSEVFRLKDRLFQGGPKIKKKDQGSIFFELPPGLGLTKYVSGRLSIYGNGISIFG